MNQLPAIGPMGSPISRRTLLAATLGLAGGAALSACAPVGQDAGAGGDSGSSNGKLQLTMFCFLGGDLAVMPKEFAAQYMDDNPNVEITFYEESNSVGYGKMLAQRQADPEKPLVNLGFFNASTTVQGVNDEMWQPLGYSDMANAGDILPTFTRADEMGIGIGSDQIGLLYNSELVTTAPTSWADLWDEANADRLAFFGFPYYAVVMAARLNGGDENNLEPGWQLWNENADLIRLIVESNPQYLNVLSDGSAAMTSYFAGTGQQWINDGAPLAYSVPEEGAVPVPVYLQSVAGQDDDQLEVCQDIIDQMLSPEWSSRWAETSVQVPANSVSALPESLAGLPAFQQSTVDSFVDIDWDVIGTNMPEWTDRWNSEIASKI